MKLRQGGKHALMQQQCSSSNDMHTRAHTLSHTHSLTHTQVHAPTHPLAITPKQHVNLANACSSSSSGSSSSDDSNNSKPISSSLWEAKVAARKRGAAKAMFRGVVAEF